MNTATPKRSQKKLETRGTLYDVASATGWGEHIEPIIGLLTCGLGALYDVLQEVKKFEGKSDLVNKT